MDARLPFIASILFSASIVSAQDSTAWHFNGNLGVYNDAYSMTADPPGTIRPRRPGSLSRFIGSVNFSKGNFSMPVNWMLSTFQSSPVIPTSDKQSFTDYVRNPANQVSVAPRYRWAQLVLGTQYPVYSELSVGDLPVFGAGLNLQPGKFRFSASYGTTQFAIAEDTNRNIQGFYARKIYSAKIGVGDEAASHIYLITSKIQDDTSSLAVKPNNTNPQTGTLSSLDFRLKLAPKCYVKGEIAGSAFTRDLRSRSFASEDLPVKLPSSIFTIQESSRFDYASVLNLYKEGQLFSFRIGGRYIGDGFVPLGYPFMQTDRMDLTFDPRFNLNQGKIQLSSSIGKRINNLSETRGARATQTLASLYLNWQLSDHWSFGSSFTNFDFRNSVSNDTLRLQMVTLSWNVSPTYTLMTVSNIHVFTADYSRNTFSDFNSISGALNDNNSHNASLSYNLSKISSPLNIMGMYSYFNNHSSFGQLLTHSFYVSADYRFFS